MQSFTIAEHVTVGPEQPLLLIAGPCVIESTDQCLQIAEALRGRCERAGFGFVFKASFDKANRSSIASPRGPGLDDGLETLAQVRRQIGVPATTDIHESHQAAPAGQVVDLIQIPAFLCRQTDLLVAAAATGKPVNVKKGQFLAPAEMTNVVGKLAESDAAGVMLTDRGTFFGYHRLVNDFIGLADLMDLGHPVCFDVTHSTQQPGGLGASTGGRRDRAPLLARLAVAAGVHALFIETHPDPDHARSDAAVQLPVERTLALIDELAALRRALP